MDISTKNKEVYFTSGNETEACVTIGLQEIFIKHKNILLGFITETKLCRFAAIYSDKELLEDEFKFLQRKAGIRVSEEEAKQLYKKHFLMPLVEKMIDEPSHFNPTIKKFLADLLGFDSLYPITLAPADIDKTFEAIPNFKTSKIANEQAGSMPIPGKEARINDKSVVNLLDSQIRPFLKSEPIEFSFNASIRNETLSSTFSTPTNSNASSKKELIANSEVPEISFTLSRSDSGLKENLPPLLAFDTSVSADESFNVEFSHSVASLNLDRSEKVSFDESIAITPKCLNETKEIIIILDDDDDGPSMPTKNQAAIASELIDTKLVEDEARPFSPATPKNGRKRKLDDNSSQNSYKRPRRKNSDIEDIITKAFELYAGYATSRINKKLKVYQPDHKKYQNFCNTTEDGKPFSFHALIKKDSPTFFPIFELKHKEWKKNNHKLYQKILEHNSKF